MKKILTILLTVLFSVQFAAAQQTLYVYLKSGGLAAYTANKVTFDNDIFVFTYGDATEITNEMFSASFKVAFKSNDYKSFVQPIEVGVCFSDVNEHPTIADDKIELGSSLSGYSFFIDDLDGLDAGTTYYYRAYVKVNGVVYYGDVKSETTFEKKPTYTYVNGHEFVDLGLPSGLLWAKTNIGAEKPADDGNYYAWGETEPQTSKSYSWSSYKHGTSSSDLTKYNSSDGKTTLDPEDDAACVNWGDSCRMPTKAEFAELRNSDNCTWTWTCMSTSDGSSIHGYKVTSVKNGNFILLPASGGRYYGIFDGHGSDGNYWSSTLYSSLSDHACYLYFSSSKHYRSKYYRYFGLTVRPVADPKMR